MRLARFIGWLTLAIGLAGAGGIASFVWTRSNLEASSADASDIAQVRAGRTIYAANCASCHGDKLEGQPNWQEQRADFKFPAPPHDATGHTWQHPDQQLFTITKLGIAAIATDYKSDMVGFGDRLSDRDIWNVIAYIKSTWPPDIQARQAETTRATTRNMDSHRSNP